MRPPDGDDRRTEYIGAEARTMRRRLGVARRHGLRSTPTATSTSPTGSSDMILVGGSNIYPAEVEAALDEHPRGAFDAR